MAMTKEQLLIPRVMCMGEEKGKRLYPHSEVYVGEILTLDPSWYTYASDTGKWVGKAQVAEFPHLFRPMPWWEGRKPEELPEYLNIDGGVFKVDMYDMSAVCSLVFTIDTIQPVPLHNCNPSTREEYEEFLKQKEE